MHRKKVHMLVLAGGFLAWGLMSSATAEAAPTAEMLANTCAGCHGTNGISAGPAIPTLAGFPATFMKAIMKEYKSGERPSTIMGRIAKGYDDAQTAGIADFFAKQKWADAVSHPNSKKQTAVDAAKAAKGKEFLEKNKCGKCHEEDGVSQDEDTPRVAGQWLDYLIIKFEDMKNKDLEVPQPKKMKSRIDEMTAEELEAVAHFYAGKK